MSAYCIFMAASFYIWLASFNIYVLFSTSYYAACRLAFASFMIERRLASALAALNCLINIPLPLTSSSVIVFLLDYDGAACELLIK